MNIFTIVYLGLIAVMVVAFFLKQYIQRWLVMFARILVIISVFCALVSVFTVSPFVYLAERSLENVGTLETLQKIDIALPISQVVTPVRSLVDKIKELWNGKKNQPVWSTEKTTTAGILEQEVYPSLVAIIAKTYKMTTMGLALLGLVLSMYLNYSIAGISEIEMLKKKYSQLERKIENLHEKEDKE